MVNTYFSIRSIIFSGNNVLCPCCDHSFRKFYPDGKFGQCPRCGSSARHRLFLLFLERKTNFFKEKLKVLHFAPEYGLYRKFKRMKNLDYITADLDSPRAKYRIDMTDIPFEEYTIDVVFSIHVLEHISNDIDAIKELCRVQKPTGWSVHLVPINKSYKHTYENIKVTNNKDRARIYGHYDHKRICGLDYYDRFKQAGFKVIPERFAQTLNSSELKKYSINPNEIIYLCLKN